MPPYRSVTIALVVLLAFSLFACDDEKPPAPAKAPSEPSMALSAGPAASVKKPAAEKPAAIPALRPPKDPNEACAQVIVVAWQGAEHAQPTVKLDKAQARARAIELIKEAKQQPDFAALAENHSDAPGSGQRGGHIGTYTREKWPEIYSGIRNAVFALQVNEIAAEPFEAPFGQVIMRRCPVERARARHILIRYQGARSGGDKAAHTREQAEALAEKLLEQAKKPGADFAALAREHSEDSSAARGGDVGLRARGELARAFEKALFTMSPGQISGPVVTEFGFHIIQREE